jgi:hypothetical protein
MNYIARLQADLAVAQTAIAVRDQIIQEFRIHLSGDKFAGYEPDGSRKDWIAVADVFAWLSRIASAEPGEMEGSPAVKAEESWP